MAFVYPRIIQGGMGVGVSSWKLARAVSKAGQLGVFSGVAAPNLVIRVLENGDPGGHFRRAFDAFPYPEYAEQVWDKYYKSEGRKGRPYKYIGRAHLHPTRDMEEMAVLCTFAQAWLAKEGHDGLVGINLLEKIQMTHPATVFGALMGGVDVMIVGAGIPDQFPSMIDKLCNWEAIGYRVKVMGARDEEFFLPFDPNVSFGHNKVALKRPKFFPIISSNLLANFLQGCNPDGFVVEAPTAGGHNAPPRGKLKLNERGEPIYGPRDLVDFAKLKNLGIPFYCAGSYSNKESVKAAMDAGAVGIQCGSIFALCDDSGFMPDLRAQARKMAFHSKLDVYTDPLGSPSGFPFKVAMVPGTMGMKEVYEARRRVCNIGGFKDPARTDDGELVYRCPAEPIKVYTQLGGTLENTEGRKCLCNGLMAAVGLGQEYPDGSKEPPLMTMGDDTSFVHQLMKHEEDGWTAKDAIQYLLNFFD